jgi:superoxide dismutase, Fe-Mn family
MYKYQLPELPYDFSALEPIISAEIMTLHYTKHHQAYVNNLNIALEQYAQAESKNDLPAMIALESAIKFNGGGHINHSIFWNNLSPVNKLGGQPPKGALDQAIQKDFGSLQNLIDQLSTRSIAIQGSGWGWLGYNKTKDKLEIAICENQTPLSTQNLVPLLGIDVWEHAYYLQYKNVRAEYVKSIWQIINWDDVAKRYQEVKINK